jgi:hypothetical protein
MADEHDYGLVHSFHIDHGELDDLSPQECFTLGVEWQMFRAQLEDGEPFERQVHGKNVGRLKALVADFGRTVTDHWVHEDYPEWRLLRVA